MKTVHIIQSQHAEQLKKHLLLESQGLVNVEVLSFDVAFGLDQNAHELMLQALQIIKSLNLEALGESALHPMNIENFLSFIKELKLYGITPTNLPSQSALEKDNKLIIEALYDLVSTPRVDNTINYIAYDHFLKHEQKLFMQTHQIPIHAFPSVNPTIKHQKTLNIRHEFESVLQEVLSQKLDSATFIIPSLNERIPLIESILQRYEMPFQLQDRTPLLVSKKFIKLLQYLQDPNQETLIEALTHHCFGLRRNLDLIYLIELFQLGNVLPETLVSQNKDIQIIIERSQEDYTLLLNTLNSLDPKEAFDELVVQTYNLLKKLNNDNLSTLQNYIETNLHHYDNSTASLFIYHYEKIGATTQSHGPFIFYDLNDFSIKPEDHVYAIDMNSKNFPSISPNTGVLDDAYRGKITSYPSLEDRTQHTLKNKNTFLRSSKNLTLSYAYTNYEGKGQEPSYELFGQENVIPIAPVAQKMSDHKDQLSLGRGFVEALLMSNGRFHTSISALETYQKDPILFFMRYGLKYYELEYPTFGPLHLGNINHDAIEYKLQNKEHPKNLWNDFPSSIRLKMIQARNDALMLQNFHFISESLEASNLKPEFFEYQFEPNTLFDGFQVGGKIDRIDMHDNQFIIYDYKSSPTSLAPRSIQNGEQLQLLTYGFILEQVLNKQMLGVYYYGLRSQNILENNYQFSRRLGITEVDPTSEVDWIKKRQYKGLLFDDINDQFNQAIYHQRLTEDKKNPGIIKLSRKPFNKETTLSVLKNVYKRYYDCLSSGQFDSFLVKQALRPDYIIDLQSDLPKEDQ